MKLLFFLSVATALQQDPLSYRSIEPVYTPPKPNTTTLLDLITSRPDLSGLNKAITQVGVFKEAFGTTPTWGFTFFAPNNEAFNHTGRYFETFRNTPYPLSKLKFYR